VGRYLDGVVADKSIRLEMAERMRHGANTLSAATADTAGSVDDGDAKNAGSLHIARRKEACNILVMDESEADVLRALCRDTPSTGSTDATGPSMVLRDRMDEFLRMPMDSLEVAVLLGSQPIDTMMYFMAYDDPRSLVKRIYETAMRVGGLSKAASLLCGPETGHPGNVHTFRKRAALQTLQEAQCKVDALWADATDPATSAVAAADNDDPMIVKYKLELFARKESLRMMRSVLTGDLDGQRHNMIRAAVAREEFLGGLYSEPAMRCFGDAQATASTVASVHSGDAHGQVPPAEWATDRDVIQIMREKLASLADASDTRATTTASAAEPWWRAMLPKLGEPATKAYCADFLRPVDHTQPMERPCIKGERYCASWWMSSHGAWPANGALNRANGAFVGREFYPPDVWAKILREDALPETGTQCLLCKRFTAKYHWVQLCLLDLQSRCVVPPDPSGTASDHVYLGTLLGQDHCNAIEPDGGYSEADMLPIGRPGDGSWTGIMAPIVALCFNRYIPGKCVPPITINQRPNPSGGDAESTRPELPCYFEQSSSDFS